jgi:hypothetical protein
MCSFDTQEHLTITQCRTRKEDHRLINNRMNTCKRIFELKPLPLIKIKELFGQQKPSLSSAVPNISVDL